MYYVTIYNWKLDTNKVTSFLYWKYAYLHLIETNVPISYRRSISLKEVVYDNIGNNIITKNFLFEELSLTYLSPNTAKESKCEEVIYYFKEANEKGIEEIAKKVGMKIPFYHPDPEGYFECYIKYYITDIIISDEEIFDKLSYFPYYKNRIELFKYMREELIPILIYKNEEFFYQNEKLDMDIFLESENKLIFKPNQTESYTKYDLKKILNFLTFFEKRTLEKISIAKKILLMCDEIVNY